MQLEDFARKEIERMNGIVENTEVLDKKGEGILELAKAYYKDSKHFLDKKDFIRAFEAVIISWAYIDSGLHLGVFKVPEELKDNFTIE